MKLKLSSWCNASQIRRLDTWKIRNVTKRAFNTTVYQTESFFLNFYVRSISYIPRIIRRLPSQKPFTNIYIKGKHVDGSKSFYWNYLVF